MLVINKWYVRIIEYNRFTRYLCFIAPLWDYEQMGSVKMLFRRWKLDLVWSKWLLNVNMIEVLIRKR